MFTDTQIEQMREYDLSQLLPDGTQPKKQGNYLVSRCPFCGGVDRFQIKLSINRWICRHCQESYANAIDYVIKRDRCEFSAALDTLGALLNLRPLQGRDAKIAAGVRQHTKRLPTTVSVISGGVTSAADLTALLPTIETANRRLLAPTCDKDKAARDALYSRGITDLEIERFKLGYLPDWVNVGQLSISPKLIIPRFVDGQLMGVNSKTYRDPKYRFSGKRGVFNGDGIETADNVIVVEGEFDAILLSRFTTAHVITLGGSSHTLSPSEKLSLSFARNIYALFDGDESGQSGAAKLANELGVNRVKMLSIPADMDVTDVWKVGGDCAILDLLPDVLIIPSITLERDVWIGKQTDLGIVQVVLGDGHFMTTRGVINRSDSTGGYRNGIGWAIDLGKNQALKGD